MMPFRFSLPERWLIYVFGALIILLALITVVGERGVLHLWRLRGEKNSLDEQNFHLQKENEALRQRVYRIRNDNAYLEKLAREELNLVRPGEIVYRFSNPANRSGDHKADARAGTKSRGAAGEKPKP
ncbi:MAG TPA: septum formation initiator family protein [Candidatus Binatia bacterium]|jgi:cell division protein FtsB